MPVYLLLPATKVRAKTLLIFSEDDVLRIKEKTLNNHIKDSKLVIIGNAGHMPQEDNPEAFFDVVQSFLGYSFNI